MRGAETAARFAALVGEEGRALLSGHARGIDQIAERAALQHRGRVIAVLPCSLDKIYPASARTLAEAILDGGGALVSEHPIYTQLQRAHFIQRDRLQAGLSSALFMAEGSMKSGALHAALTQSMLGRTLWVPPPSRGEEDARRALLSESGVEGLWRQRNDQNPPSSLITAHQLSGEEEARAALQALRSADALPLKTLMSAEASSPLFSAQYSSSES